MAGHSLGEVGRQLGITQQAVTQILSQESVAAQTAVKVADLFERLHMTVGPSSRARNYALRRGWHPALAWDDIDNPDEAPNLGTDRRASFMERYEECRDHIGLADRQIAERMGIQLNSLQVAISREKRKKAA